MAYNTSRPKLTLPEYGRNVQNMVNYAMTISDRAERQECAETIIQVMSHFFPQQKGTPDFERMLWDHLALISDYKLDVDSPYPITVISNNEKEQPHLDYPEQKICYRHYGHILEQMIKALPDIADDEERQQAIEMVVAQMATSLAIWNNNVLSATKLATDLSEMTDGRIEMTIDPQRLDRIISAARANCKPVNTGKKKKK